MKYSGIYKITNVLNGEFYIGQSKDVNIRLKHHYKRLQANGHKNKHLQYAWNLYGECNFIFTHLLYCETYELTRYEQAFVNILKPQYNILIECVDSSLGYKHSEETKKLLSEMKTGKAGSLHTEEYKKYMSEINKGRVFSEEHNKKISESRKGKPTTLGRKHSEETKKKISETKKRKGELL